MANKKEQDDWVEVPVAKDTEDWVEVPIEQKKSSDGSAGTQSSATESSSPSAEIPEVTVDQNDNIAPADQLIKSDQTPYGLTQEDGKVTGVVDHRKEELDQLKKKTLDIFGGNPIFDNPRNRDIYYNALLKKYTPKEVDEIIGDDRWQSPGVTIGAIPAQPARRNPANGQVQMEDLSKAVPPLHRYLESVGGGIKHGIEGFKALPEVYEKEGLASAALQTIVATGTTALSAGAAVVPTLAGFTVATNEIINRHPEAAKAFTLFQDQLTKTYTDAGKEPPAWVKNTGEVVDFLWQAAVLGEAKYGYDKFVQKKNWTPKDINDLHDQTQPKNTPAVQKLIDEHSSLEKDVSNVPPEVQPMLQEQMAAVKEKITKKQDEATNTNVEQAATQAMVNTMEQAKASATTDAAKKVFDDKIKELKPETPQVKPEPTEKPKQDATEKVNQQESVQPERESGNVSGETEEASSSDSVQRAEEGKEKVTDTAVGGEPEHQSESKVEPPAVSIPSPEKIKAVAKKAKVSAEKKADGATLKEQKNNLLSQVGEVIGHAKGKSKNPLEKVMQDEASRKDAIAKIKKAGYQVSDDGIVTFDVKDDGTFKLNLDGLEHASEQIKKHFPTSQVHIPKIEGVRRSGAGKLKPDTSVLYTKTIPEAQRFYDDAKENLATAKNSGNKPLIDHFRNEAVRAKNHLEELQIEENVESEKAVVHTSEVPTSEKRFINVGNVDFEQVNGEPFKNDEGIDVFTHKDENGNLILTEGRTGMEIARGEDMKAVKKRYSEIVKKHGVDEMKVIISQSENRHGTSPRYAPVKEEKKEETKKEKAKSKVDDILDSLDQAKVDTKNKVFDAVLGIAAKTWNAAIEIIKAAIKGGAKLHEAIKKGLEYLRAEHGTFDEPLVKEKIKDVIKKKPSPESLGFMHEKHIVNAVNKYMRKNYSDYESIPRKEVADMLRRRKAASPEAKLEEQINEVTSKKQTLKEKFDAAIDLAKKIEIVDPLKRKAAELSARAAAIWDSYVHEPKWTDLHQAIGEYSLQKQKNDREVKELMDAAKAKVPSPIKREAISNWIEAGGDMDVLRERARVGRGGLRVAGDKSKNKTDKYHKGYEAALHLTPQEIQVAQVLKKYLDDMFRQGFQNGLIQTMLEDYITHIGVKEDNPVLGKLQYDIASWKINTSFQYARKRTFDTFYDLEQAGYRAVSKDFADIIGVYSQTFNKAIYSRAFVKSMTKGKASDGRPLVAQSGTGSLTDASDQNPTQTMMVNPFTKGEEIYDYKSINHPAFRNWYWATKGPDKTNVFAKGDLVVHPEIYKHLDNILGKSTFRNNWAGRNFMALSTFTKKTIFSLSPFFHYVQEGTHAVGHTINPGSVVKIDFNDPVQKKAIEHGLMLYDYNAAHNFTEGLSGGSLGKKIPIYNSTVIPLQEFLFQDYIPRLKMTTFKHALERNMERSKDDLKKGKITEDQIYAKTARQMNAAYGHLNYDLIGRNKTTQDLFRAVSLAPDFLEARIRFVGQALTPRGAEQRRALLVLAVSMYVTARILNKLLDDDYHFDEPFAVIHNKKKYQLRSVPSDIWEMMNDFGKFAYHRIAPYSGVLLEAVTKYDLARGQEVTYSDVAKDAATAMLPNQVKELFPDKWQKFPHDQKLYTDLINTMGIKESKYTPAEKVEAFKLLDELKSMDIGDEHKKAIRQFKSLIESGDTAAAYKMWEENIASIVEKMKKLPPDFSYKIKKLIPRYYPDDDQPLLPSPVQSPKVIPDEEKRKPIPR